MIGHEIGRCATPMPIETIDSPIATMMINPCRSAKWLAEPNRQPWPDSSVPR